MSPLNMRNIKLTVEYDGTNYAGWQTQNSCQLSGVGCKQKTIQETIEKAIKKIIHKKVKLLGSGRTDAGVHAKGQVANFKTDSGITIEKLRGALNAVLPSDIAVIKAEEAGLTFHSQFSAKSKVYRYTILNRPSRSAILCDTVYFIPYPLNLRLMREEAKFLLGRHNFKSFQAADKKKRGAVRAVKNLKITRDKDFIYIDMEADGFLYNMVRNVAGTLIEIGRGKLPKGSMEKILLSKNRRLAGPTVAARGLTLVKVNY